MANKDKRAPKNNKPKLSIKQKREAKKSKKAAGSGSTIVLPGAKG